MAYGLPVSVTRRALAPDRSRVSRAERMENLQLLGDGFNR